MDQVVTLQAQLRHHHHHNAGNELRAADPEGWDFANQLAAVVQPRQSNEPRKGTHTITVGPLSFGPIEKQYYFL